MSDEVLGLVKCPVRFMTSSGEMYDIDWRDIEKARGAEAHSGRRDELGSDRLQFARAPSSQRRVSRLAHLSRQSPEPS